MTRRTFVSLIAAFAVAVVTSPALAHEGHAHKVMGTVTTVHENHLEVKDVKGVVTTHTLDAKTKVRRDKTVLKMADIKAGDRVVVTYIESKDKATGKKIVTVTEVQLGAAATATTAKQQ